MVKIEISAPIGYTQEMLKDELLRLLPIEKSEILDLEILKRALDIKQGGEKKYKITLAASFSPEREEGLLKMRKTVFPYEKKTLEIPEAQKASDHHSNYNKYHRQADVVQQECHVKFD